MAKMLKVRCTWVDIPAANGFEAGMVFEVEGVSEGRFTLVGLVWAKRKSYKKMADCVDRVSREKPTLHNLPFDGNLWKFKLVE